MGVRISSMQMFVCMLMLVRMRVTVRMCMQHVVMLVLVAMSMVVGMTVPVPVGMAIRMAVLVFAFVAMHGSLLFAAAVGYMGAATGATQLQCGQKNRNHSKTGGYPALRVILHCPLETSSQGLSWNYDMG